MSSWSSFIHDSSFPGPSDKSSPQRYRERCSVVKLTSFPARSYLIRRPLPADTYYGEGGGGLGPAGPKVRPTATGARAMRSLGARRRGRERAEVAGREEETRGASRNRQ